MKTNEGNKLIAEYMGWIKMDKLYNGEETFKNENAMGVRWLSLFKYHSSFSELIPVVEKLEEETEFELVIYSTDCFWNRFGDRPEGLENEFNGNRINSIWNAVVAMIQLINKNSET